MVTSDLRFEDLPATCACSCCGEPGNARLFSPADPLTRLMMEADGVSPAELDALLMKIATVVANREPVGTATWPVRFLWAC